MCINGDMLVVASI